MEYTTIGAVPLIVGVVEMAKQLGMPKRLAPILAVLLGVASAFLLERTGTAQTILTGIVYGLGAAGLYSGTKTTVKKVESTTK